MSTLDYDDEDAVDNSTFEEVDDLFWETQEGAELLAEEKEEAELFDSYQLLDYIDDGFDSESWGLDILFDPRAHLHERAVRLNNWVQRVIRFYLCAELDFESDDPTLLTEMFSRYARLCEGGRSGIDIFDVTDGVAYLVRDMLVEIDAPME